MLNESNTIVKNILSAILFPLQFQQTFVLFAWGSSDPALILFAKRLFLLLPVLAVIAALWISIASVLSVLFRNNRQQFIVSLFIMWWDLGKAIFSFWGGIFKFIFIFTFSFLALLKVIIFGIWAIIQDIIIMPFRLLTNMGRKILSSQVPVVAVIFTLFWCLLEAVIFSYITTPLVIDVFTNITGNQLAENSIRIPLFLFLFFVVLGSYAVLSTFFTYIKSKNIGSIVGVFVIEVVVIFVEVTFLYREFVDSLVPWFAQYSENFELGIVWTLVISGFVWFGIRSLSWFLFAAHGTPLILQTIQGKRRETSQPAVEMNYSKVHLFGGFSHFLDTLINNADLIQIKGEEILNTFILPPLQIIASIINFCTLLVTGKHLFDLPFRDAADFIDSSLLFQSFRAKENPIHPEPMRAIQESSLNR